MAERLNTAATLWCFRRGRRAPALAEAVVVTVIVLSGNTLLRPLKRAFVDKLTRKRPTKCEVCVLVAAEGVRNIMARSPEPVTFTYVGAGSTSGTSPLIKCQPNAGSTGCDTASQIKLHRLSR